MRVVSTFSYPDPASIDASEFAVVPEEAVRVVEPSALVQARTQCMVTLRDLAAMAVAYADAHDGTLPRAVEDLAPYADRPIADCLQCAVPGRDEPALIESRLAELAGDAAAAFDSRTVLFECRFGDMVLRAFGDGHVEAHEDGS